MSTRSSARRRAWRSMIVFILPVRQAAAWQGGVLGLTLATSQPGDTLQVHITAQADQYRITTAVLGSATPDSAGMNYVMSSAGRWYGQGETTTPDGGPYIRQPWPLDSDQALQPRAAGTRTYRQLGGGNA